MYESPREHGSFSEDPRIAVQEVQLALRIFVADLLYTVRWRNAAPLTDSEVSALIHAEDKFAMFLEPDRYLMSEWMVDAALSGEEFVVEFPEEDDPPTLVRFPQNG